MQSALIFTTAAFLALLASSLAHDRVIVGILTVEPTKVIDLLYKSEQFESFLPASYVKWVEQGGARVVPLFIGKDAAYYRRMMSKLNGVLLPGGGLNRNKAAGYSASVSEILKIAAEMNINGEFMPVFGIGSGMEMMLYHINGMEDITDSCSVDSVSMSLTLSAKDSRETAIYNSSSDHIRILMTSHPVAVFYAKRCHLKETFEKSSMRSLWIPFSYNIDRDGKVFVSAVEHRKLPFYGVLFHPEAVAYEWAENTNIAHTLATVEVSQYFGNYFVNECRKSSHWFDSKEEEDKFLIDNYPLEFTGKKGSKFIQSYMFRREDMMS